MTPYEVPLSPEPQALTVNLGGTDYSLRLYWCKDSQCWVLDLSDAAGVALAQGVPVVTGCDLLAPYAYLKIGGSLVAQTDHDADAVPTFDNLGLQGRLYFVVP